MELDNLKNSWSSVSADLNESNYDVVTVTKKEMESPLSALKKISKQQTIALPIVFVFLVIMTGWVPEMKTHLLVWLAFALLPLTTLYYYFNIKLIDNLEQVNGAVKSDFEHKVSQLIKGNHLYLNISRIILIALVATAELLLQTAKTNLLPGLEILESIILPLRLLIYVGIVAVHYIVSQYTFNLHFGKYLNHLKALLKEM